MAWPCWMATTRLVVNDLPSRMRSTSYRIGAPRVAGAQEVRMQGMDPTGVHGASGGDESLRCDLATEDALTGLVEVPATEDVDFDGLEVEDLDQLS